MNWTRGLIAASLIFGGSIAYASLIVGLIFWLGGWGLLLALLPLFAFLVYAEAR